VRAPLDPFFLFGHPVPIWEVMTPFEGTLAAVVADVFFVYARDGAPRPSRMLLQLGAGTFARELKPRHSEANIRDAKRDPCPDQNRGAERTPGGGMIPFRKPNAFNFFLSGLWKRGGE